MKNENTETVENEARKEKNKTRSHTKFKLAMLYVCSFLASTLPLLFVIINRWDHYAQAPSDTIKITIGGLIGLFFLFLKAIGKLKMPSRIILFSVIFVMAYLLKNLLDDIILLSGMALLGEVIDFFVFQRMIKITRENIIVSKTADATTAKVEEMIKKHLGRV
jgi:hypothetical protein